MATRLERLLSLDAYIRNHYFPSVERLCELFEVQPRTLYQDLRELREYFGLDIRYDRDRNGYYNADPKKVLPSLVMSREEALLMSIAIEMLTTTMGETFRGSLARVSEMIGSRDDQKFAWLPEAMQFEDKNGCAVKASVFVATLTCISKKEKAILRTENSRKKVTVVPLRILYTDGHWVLSAEDTMNGHENIEVPLCEVTEVSTK